MSAAMADMEPTYHDFSWLGLPTRQIEGIYAPNQAVKAPVIAAYVLLALARLRARGVVPISFAELFCADGFYAMFAARFGADHAVGFDNDRDGHLASAQRIRDRLGLVSVEFERTDIEAIDPSRRFSIVANVGGLYHVDDPEAVLRRSFAMAEHYLIVQNVVSLADTSDDYFCRPAPGLTWGNRYSRESFDALIARTGWRVLLQDFDVLRGNPRPEDQGCVFYLIEKD
ncbi:MAG: methyltransferase domain-containing protein [Thauera propionica]|jgi:hypothetical protein|nr:methyltransferase domain-containing protein [Thauera propionica]